MRERKSEHRPLVDPGTGDGFFDDAGTTRGTVVVSHGPYRETLPAAEMTIRDVRRRFRDHLDIHPQAVAMLDGEEVDDATQLRAGQMLMFIRPSGEKGARGEKGERGNNAERGGKRWTVRSVQNGGS